ncbi:MAG: HK97 family phage prohead protease [Bacteroidales bacterium]|nr:HK97 family phage prohead protease [Bacteroidales bacterium]
MNTLRYKSVKVDAPAINEESMTVSGYLASFDTVDEVGDRLHKGCFAKSIQEHGPESSSPRKIMLCYQHKMDTPIGQFTTLKEDDKGLYFEAKLDDIPLVRDTVIPQYKSGTLNQHSIGFCYVKFEWEEDSECGDVCEVYEVELYEGSVVTAGCNENTPFLGFKSMTTEQVAQAHRELDKITVKLSKFDRIKIKQLFDSLITKAEDTPPEPPTTKDKPDNTRKSINQLFIKKV